MANTTQDELFNSFTEAAGGLTKHLESLASLMAPLQSSTNPQDPKASSSGGGAGSDALSIATTVFESGLGIVPLIAGLIGLFTGGGGAETPPPLVKYAMPDKLQFESANTSGGIREGDYDQMGMPRSVAAPTVRGAGVEKAPQEIHVNVQAMDAQSFLDHSGEIAQAVRAAMLNLSSLNDVVSDL